MVGALQVDAAAVAREPQASRILSAAGSRAAVEAGLVIGLVQQGRGARVLVNIAVAHAVGADFDSTLFTAAEAVNMDALPDPACEPCRGASSSPRTRERTPNDSLVSRHERCQSGRDGLVAPLQVASTFKRAVELT